MIRILVNAAKVLVEISNAVQREVLIQGHRTLVLISTPNPFFPTGDLLLENGFFILLENGTIKIAQEGG